MQNPTDNASNRSTKKFYKRAWFWILITIAVSLLGGIIYNVALGGKDGINNFRIAHQYHKRIHTADRLTKQNTSFKLDSLQTVRAKLKCKLNTNDLTNVDYNKIDTALHQMYNKQQVQLIESGLLVSANMTPSEQTAMESQILSQLKGNKTLGGIPKYQQFCDITNGHVHKNNTYIAPTMENKFFVLQDNTNDNWQTIKGHSVSAPEVMSMPSNWVQLHTTEDSRDNGTNTIIIWIKANNGDTMNDIHKVAQSIKVKYSDRGTYGKIANHNKTQAQYKEFAFYKTADKNLPANYLNYKVLDHALIPVMFELPKHSLDGNYGIKMQLNNNSYYPILNQNNKQEIINSLIVPH